MYRGTIILNSTETDAEGTYIREQKLIGTHSVVIKYLHTRISLGMTVTVSLGAVKAIRVKVSVVVSQGMRDPVNQFRVSCEWFL